MKHQGAERRRRIVYFTRNTEYHLKDGVCVAIRDRRSQALHAARAPLEFKLEGGAKVYSNGATLVDAALPSVGDAICFVGAGEGGQVKHVVTSRVEKIERPSKADLTLYPPEREG